MKGLLSFFALVALLSSGCAQSFRLSPIVMEVQGQKVIYSDGNEVAMSYGNETTITVFGEKTGNGKEIDLYVTYVNNSGSDININPGLIFMSALSDKGKRMRLRVYTADEYLSKVRRQQKWEAFGQALQGLGETIDAGQSTAITTGSVGGIPIDATTTVNDPSKEAAARRAVENEMEQLLTKQSLVYEPTKSGLVKKNTLSPGYMISGIVKVQFEKAQKYYLTIPAGNDFHTIEFTPNSL